jgi:death-on-curing family protein
VAAIAERTGLPELEVRSRLAQEGILRSLDAPRIPRSRFRATLRVLRPQLQQDPSPSALNEATAPVSAPVAPVPEKRPRKPRRSATSFQWRTLGRPELLFYLTAGDVEAIHWALVKEFSRSRDPIEPSGIKDRNLLESAVYRPHTSLSGTIKYPTLLMAGAALFHALVLNHPFYNGNKRTALVSLLVFLDKHGCVITVDDDALFNYVLLLADHRILPGEAKGTEQYADREAFEVAKWLQASIRRIRKDELCIKFHDLRRILNTYDCTFGVPKGNRIDISRGFVRTQVFYGDEGRDVEPNTIRKIRKDLSLDEEHGYDSDIFYNAGPRVSRFINEHRKLLAALAKH